MIGFAGDSCLLDIEELEIVLTELEAAIASGEYLVLAPQFVVTAVRL